MSIPDESKKAAATLRYLADLVESPDVSVNGFCANMSRGIIECAHEGVGVKSKPAPDSHYTITFTVWDKAERKD